MKGSLDLCLQIVAVIAVLFYVGQVFMCVYASYGGFPVNVCLMDVSLSL